MTREGSVPPEGLGAAVTLRHRVWIDAPAAAVYDALATAEGLGRWWAPHAATETPGGTVLSHSPGPLHGDVRMRVASLVPERLVEWEVLSTHPPRSPASAWTGTRILFELSEQPSPGPWIGLENEGATMTRLDFRHEGWDEESEHLAFCNYAWGLTLDLLRQWCEGRGAPG